MSSLTSQPFLTPSLIRQSAFLRAELQRATQEMATGVQSDVAAHLSGDFTRLAGIDYALARAQGYASAIAEMSLAATSMQSALAAMRETGEALAHDLVTLTSTGSASQLAIVAAKGGEAFRSTIAILNSRVADRALFGGVVSDRPPLPDTEVILSGLETALAGLVGSADILAEIEAWFSSPGGFGALYQGGAARAALPLSASDSLSLEATALSPEFRRNLQGLALSALLDRGLAAGDDAVRQELARAAMDTLINGSDDLALLSARIGLAEQRIASAQSRVASENAALTLARVQMIESDPYEAAVRLEDLRMRLDTFYTIISRLSTLSLAGYLR